MTRRSPPSENDETERAHVARDVALVPSFRIVVTDGPDAGKEAALGPEGRGSLLVGTGPACDLVLSDRLVSRRHLSLDLADGPLRLTDRGSTNGTRVGALAVETVRLQGGERIHMGGTTLRVDLVAPGAPVPLWPVESFGRMLGASVAMRRLYPLLQKLAAASMPIVIEGETGTGKELLAESLHEMGPRRLAPFIVFDCAAVAAKHVETVLFGEERRTSAGAVEIHKGVFEEAVGGTLFLDEIAELPLATQSRLLRALARQEVCRVSGDSWITVDARVVAATRKDLDREVEHGRFRDDLFFRLAGARVELPPLREREGDVQLLASAFWKRMVGEAPLPAQLLASFDGYGWPGNVRELESLVARVAALGDLEDAAAPSSRPNALLVPAEDGKTFERVFALALPFPEARARVLSEFEAYFVQRVLAKHGGNVSRAAAASGIARRYFQILKRRSR